MKKRILTLLIITTLLLIGIPAVFAEEETANNADTATISSESVTEPILNDGTYEIETTLTGGTGRASIQSPLPLSVADGCLTATIHWSSSNYDYMIVHHNRYLPVSIEDGSVFEIPVYSLNKPLSIIADTTAMSTPHEISYTLEFQKDTLHKTDSNFIWVILPVIVGIVCVGGLFAYLSVQQKRSHL